MSTRYYMTVEIKVKDGKMTEFDILTMELVPHMRQRVGWKLLAALSAVTGVPNTVLHLWELPDTNALLEGMQLLATDEFSGRYTRLLGCCIEQKQEIYTAKRYNPLGDNTPPSSDGPNPNS